MEKTNEEAGKPVVKNVYHESESFGCGKAIAEILLALLIIFVALYGCALITHGGISITLECVIVDFKFLYINNCPLLPK